jgi:hypothetical protein
LKEINNVNIFQDARPLENDPLILTLLKVTIICLLIKEPDFIVSLGTGAPRIKESLSMLAFNYLHFWKDKAFLKLWRMF